MDRGAAASRLLVFLPLPHPQDAALSLRLTFIVGWRISYDGCLGVWKVEHRKNSPNGKTRGKAVDTTPLGVKFGLTGEGGGVLPVLSRGPRRPRRGPPWKHNMLAKLATVE